jgi:hypothetical protein
VLFGFLALSFVENARATKNLARHLTIISYIQRDNTMFNRLFSFYKGFNRGDEIIVAKAYDDGWAEGIALDADGQRSTGTFSYLFIYIYCLNINLFLLLLLLLLLLLYY